MGIVARHGSKITLISYAGAVLGMVNGYLLKPNLVEESEVELNNVLSLLGVMYAYSASFGLPGIILKFFPYFHDKARGHHGILLFGLFICSLGTLCITALFIFLKPWLISTYIEDAPLLVEYFVAIIPLGISMMVAIGLEYYLQALIKAVVPSLVKDLFIKLGSVVLIILFGLGLYSFTTFVILFVAVHTVAAAALLVYAWYLKQLSFAFLKPSFRMRRLARQMMIFGGFTYLMSVTSWGYQLVDSLMLAAYFDMETVGVYTTMIFLLSFRLKMRKVDYSETCSNHI